MFYTPIGELYTFIFIYHYSITIAFYYGKVDKMIKNNLLNRFLAEALIYKISEKHLTQKEVAHSLNISESFLSDSIYGRKKFNIRHIYLIVRELNVSASFIFPNKDTFELIKNQLGYEDFNEFLTDMDKELYKEEYINE